MLNNVFPTLIVLFRKERNLRFYPTYRTTEAGVPETRRTNSWIKRTFKFKDLDKPHNISSHLFKKNFPQAYHQPPSKGKKRKKDIDTYTLPDAIALGKMNFMPDVISGTTISSDVWRVKVLEMLLYLYADKEFSDGM